MSNESGFQVTRNAPSFYESHVALLMAPFVEALVAATVSPGNSVLDVACGTGFATRAAAAVAGRGSRIDGSDLNPAMVTQARAVPNDSGATIEWREASALDLPYDVNSFDAVICQQGAQFFPDPAAGIAEMARVARPGARIGLTAWSAEEPSRFLLNETAMLARHGGGAQAAYETTTENIRTWFADAGIDDLSVELVTAEVDLPPVLTYVPEHLQALPWSASFFELPAEQQQAALHELDTELDEFRTATGIRIPFSSHLATATIGQ